MPSTQREQPQLATAGHGIRDVWELLTMDGTIPAARIILPYQDSPQLQELNAKIIPALAGAARDGRAISESAFSGIVLGLAGSTDFQLIVCGQAFPSRKLGLETYIETVTKILARVGVGVNALDGEQSVGVLAAAFSEKNVGQLMHQLRKRGPEFAEPGFSFKARRLEIREGGTMGLYFDVPCICYQPQSRLEKLLARVLT